MKKTLYFSTTLDNGNKVNVKTLIKITPKIDFVNLSILLPFSIFSKLYDGDVGKLKVDSLLHFVKIVMKGKITVLLCEGAHLEVGSLKYLNKSQALTVNYLESEKILNRFKSSLENLDIIYWVDFVNRNINYDMIKARIYDLYENNLEFKEIVRVDIENTLLQDTYLTLQNKDLYFEKCKLDILEQCVCLYIASINGYKYALYPGQGNDSFKFSNNVLLNDTEKLTYINASIHTPIIKE